MNITEVNIHLVDGRPSANGNGRLRAYCSIVLDDCLCVRDIRVIDGGERGLFIAFPYKRHTDACAHCHAKNLLRSRYCHACGAALPVNRDVCRQCSTVPNYSCERCRGSGRLPLFGDIAHPVNATFRNIVQEQILATYQQELALSTKRSSS